MREKNLFLSEKLDSAASDLSREKFIERSFKDREIGDSGHSSTFFKNLKTIDK